MIKILKSFANYALILCCGLAIGYAAIQLPTWTRNNYLEGDYSSYFQGTSHSIVVYGTSSCPFCKKTRDYLRQLNINFEDLDIETSEKGRQDFARLGESGVPVILIGRRLISGFDPKEIDAAIKEAGLKIPLARPISTS